MTISLPLWSVALALSGLVAWWGWRMGQSTGQWDFVSPLLGLAVFASLAAFWVGVLALWLVMR